MAETRNARCHLLGCKHADANDMRPLEEFLRADFSRYPGPLDSLWGKIDGTAFGLNLYLYPSPPVSSFSSCGHHSSILFSELSIPRCVVVKIATGSVSTISVWYSNATNQDCKALQRVVRLAERISGSALPSLQDIYLKRCKSRAAKIIKDSNHPSNHLFITLPSGKRFRSMMAKTERLRRSFFPQAIRLLNSVS